MAVGVVGLEAVVGAEGPRLGNSVGEAEVMIPGEMEGAEVESRVVAAN